MNILLNNHSCNKLSVLKSVKVTHGNFHALNKTASKSFGFMF